MPETRQIGWALCLILAVGVLAGTGLLATRLRPYWVAKHRGPGANLNGCILTHASLRDAPLYGAHLRQADLAGADLRDANLSSADLTRASLVGADLRGAFLEH